MRELELKFGVHGSFSMPDATALGMEVVGHQEEKTLKATYYDTPDLRLIRRGISLRYRTGEGPEGIWTVKLPADRQGNWVSREELNFEGAPRKVPPEALSLTIAAARNARLGPVAVLRTRRRSLTLKTPSDVEIAEIVDDEVSVIEQRRVVIRFREIEVEARAATEEELKRIRDHLVEAGAGELEPIPKLVRAIGPQATMAHDLAEKPEVGSSQPASATVKAALMNGVDRLISNDPIARLGNNTGIHQMRVATRRLRSDLKTFEPLLDLGASDDLTAELKALTHALGRVRELDVMLTRLTSMNEDLAPDLKPMLETLEARRASAREELDRELTVPDYGPFLERLAAIAIDPPFTETARQPAEEVLPALVKARWEALRKQARNLRPSDPEDDFHGVRLDAKKARYAAEAVAGSLDGKRGKKATSFAEAIADLQDILGAHQDAVVARDHLIAESRRNADPVFNMAAGRAIERQIQDSLSQRAKFFSAWDRLDREKNVAWLNA